MNRAYKIIDEAKKRNVGSFKLINNSPNNIMTDEDILCFKYFIMRLLTLPNIDNPKIEIKNNGKYIIKNIDYYKHIINEYRTIIYNQNDKIYYQKIINHIIKCLIKKDPCETEIVVYDLDGVNITQQYNEYVESTKKK